MKQLNIIVAGKSGVGKSSLLNYLVGKDIFETGVGEPVTQEYFNNHTYSSPENGVQYCLYDTKGIEPSTTEEFLSEIYGKIDMHDALGDIFDSIHTVYYCLAASSKRAENFEIEFIQELSECTSVVILLTKSDQVTKNEIIDLKEYLNKSLDAAIQIVPVCSVEAKTRKGTSSPFGKEDILKHGFLGLWNKLAKTLTNKLDPTLSHGITVPLTLEKESVFIKHIDSVNLENGEFVLPKIKRTKYLWDRHFKKRLRIAPEDQLSLVQLFFLPTLKSLKLNDLDLEDLLILENFANDGIHLLENLDEKISSVIINFKKECREEQIKVLDFYSKIIKTEISYAHSYMADKELNDIVSYLKLNVSPALNETLNEIIKNICIVRNSNTTLNWFFNNDNRYELRESLRSLQEISHGHATTIVEQLNLFNGIFEAELHQYGQLVIKAKGDVFNT